MIKKAFIVLIFFAAIPAAFSQKDEVSRYLRYVAYGKIDEVRAAIPDLLAKYPDDPGVKLLHGTVIEDAFLALNVYNGIIKNYPESEWADHAYWRIVQFYAVLGDTTKAQEELNNFRSRYPASPFIGPASDVVRSSLLLAKRDMKSAVKKPAESVKTEPFKSPAGDIRSSGANPAVTATAKTPDADRKNENMLAPKSDVEIKQLPVGEQTAKLPQIPDQPKQESKNLPEINEGKTEKSGANPVMNGADKEGDIFYGLQVGIYKDKISAEAEKNKFLVRRLRTQVIEKQVNNAVMYAVVIGHYSSMESAEEGKKIVSIQCNCEPLIYKK